MIIDAHVHLRDFNEKHKETVKHGLEVALDSGVSAVFEMPNTKPPIIDEKTVKERIELYKQAGVNGVFCGMYIGLTSDPEQVKNAVEISRKYFPLVVGMKLYAGKSVGDLAVVHPVHQLTAYLILVQEGYDGVLAVHAEKELLMNENVFSPEFPISHCFARPPIVEYESIKDQIKFARLTKFKGKLHIPHISCPESVELVTKEKKLGLDISSGVCPHHFMFDMDKLLEKNGLLWKMNPALRPKPYREKMLQLLYDEKIDWIETDHAPHTLEEKTVHSFMSGIPGLPWWPLFIEYLRNHNFSEDQIERLTFTNARNRFGIDIKKTKRQIKDRKQDYAFNPYEEIERRIDFKFF